MKAIAYMHIFLFLIHSVSCSKYIYFESLLSLSCFPSQTNHNDFQLNPVSNLSTVCSFHNSLYLDFISGLHLWTQAFFFFYLLFPLYLIIMLASSSDQICYSLSHISWLNKLSIHSTFVL